jgi:hypothetical protein
MSHLSRKVLIDYRIDNLQADDRRACADHLQSCDACRISFQNLERLFAELGALPTEQAPADLEEHVFALVDHDPTIQLLHEAPLAPLPGADLEDRSLSQIDGAGGLVKAHQQEANASSRTRWRVLVAVAAVLATALAFTTWRVADLNDRLERVPGTGVPPGHEVQEIPLASGAGQVHLELIHFRHDNYKLLLYTKDFPVQKAGHHYEMWLDGKGGPSLAGSFRITHRDQVTFQFNIGIDPAEHNRIEIIEARDGGSLSRQGTVVAEGVLDPAHVDH